MLGAKNSKKITHYAQDIFQYFLANARVSDADYAQIITALYQDELLFGNFLELK